MAPTPDQEDPELDFTDFMEKHKANLQAAPAPSEPVTQSKTMSPIAIRGIIFFVILLALLGVLIFLFLNRQQGAIIQAPDGYRIIQSPNSPPSLQKIQ